MLKAFPKRSSEGPGASHPQWTFDVIRGFHFRRNLCRPWGCQQGFSLGSKWWMGSCCFHVFCCLRHILRQSDSSRITLCSLRITEKNKMKKEPVSVPCQTWKYLSKKAASTVLRAKYQVPAGWVGGECLKDAVARHQEAAVLLQYCSWCFVSSRLRFRARRKLTISEILKKLKAKFPSPVSLVGFYWFQGTWIKCLEISEGWEDTHAKCFYFLIFHLFPRVIWGYVEHVQLSEEFLEICFLIVAWSKCTLQGNNRYNNYSAQCFIKALLRDHNLELPWTWWSRELLSEKTETQLQRMWPA